MGEYIEYIDISVPISPALPVWPGSPTVELVRRLDLDRRDPVNDTTMRCSVHTGTHLDAPLHFLAGGTSVDALPLDVLVGPAYVADLGEVDAVTADALGRAGIPDAIARLLVRTRNSALWSTARAFQPNYVALTPDAAEWVVDRGIRLIGVDYLSVQRYSDGPETHLTLLSAGVVIVEGLNLQEAAAGRYDLLCLPLRIQGAEGAPARAVLRTLR
jgi:arylformamidase